MLGQLATPWRRSLRTTWGATAAELETALPGDDLVANPSWHYTHAITIAAPSSAVWPWLAQLGQGRGGFYSFERLENLAGCHIHNTDRILADHQSIAVGDPIRLHPKIPPLRVALVETGHHLVLASALRDAVSIWGFHLVDGHEGSTRLVERGWYHTGPRLSERLSFGPLILEPVSYVMSKQMLRTIRIRAEQATPNSSPEPPTPITARS